MYELGLVSVSFRNNTPEEIVKAAKAAGLKCIEWGSDVHAPWTNEERLEHIACLQEKYGISCCSYGTYFRAGQNKPEDITGYINVAKKLDTDILRIWCGVKGSIEYTEEDKEKIYADCRKIAEIAAENKVFIECECHIHTLTDTKESALKLMQNVNSPAFGMYWQPNQFNSDEENLAYAELLKEYITHIHVFNWKKHGKFPLSEAHEIWQRYLTAIGGDHKLLLEFMPDDLIETLPREAAAMVKIAEIAKGGNAEMKNRAIYLGGEGTIKNVYTAETKMRISEIVSIEDKVYSKTDVLEKPESFRNVKYIFSTWGMPAFSEEEIKKVFPELECVFYGAGSVQGFARPFLNAGVKVFSAWGANAVPVAEYTVAQIILANKGFFKNSQMYKSAESRSNISKNITPYYRGNFEENVGIIGAGMIGRLVIKLLKAYRLNVLVFDPFLPDEKATELGVEKCSLEELFKRCSVVSNHLANNAQTKGMLKYTHFNSMKKYATFINTGRGAQVVEDDLVQALTERPDLMAILDVTHPEPPVDGHAFYKLDNCILTTHIAGSLGNEVHRMSEYMLYECKNYIEGLPCQYEVSLEMLETMA